MTFWNFDEEVKLFSNKPKESHVHATEARSAFGATDFINTSSATTSSGSSGSTSSISTPKTSATQISPSSSSPSETSVSAVTAATGQPPQKQQLGEKVKAFHQHQASVPVLPVPDLKGTLDLYLQSLEGLVSAEVYERNVNHVQDFLAKPQNDNNNNNNNSKEQEGENNKEGSPSSNENNKSIGEMLQEMLIEHSATAKPSWLEAFWDDMYLSSRDPIPINVNYFFSFTPSPSAAASTSSSSSSSSGGETQIGRAASLIHAAAGMYNEVRTGNWSLDFERKAPQCMSQYRRVFAASRIPGQERDTIVTYLPGVDLAQDELNSRTSEYAQLPNSVPKHIVVIIRNRFFTVDVLDGTTLEVLSIEEIGRRLAYIVSLATAEGAATGPPVGVLTTMNRTQWFEARENLASLGNGINETNLLALQSAIWVVALDSYACSDLQELARICLHGPGTNRWFDRTELIVTQNGDAGLNFEHSIGDGATTLRVADDMIRKEKGYHSKGTNLSKEKVEKMLESCASQIAAAGGPNSATASNNTLGVRELRWKLDGSLDMVLRSAYQTYVELIQSTETTTLDFKRFGGDYIKKSGNSPDAFVQLSFQLTHHRLFGKPTATYEAASTRTFSHGRTEVVRSVTRAATDFCAMSGEPIFTHRVNSSIPGQLQLLKKATAAHVEFMKRSKEGRGVDRHLLGLRLMAAKAQIPLPGIFTDDTFRFSTHWGLSTSHCGSPALTLFGFGPVVPDGFGLGYMIKNDSVQLCITSKYTHRYHSSTVFATMLESSLLQMSAIVDADWEARTKARPKAIEFSHPTSFSDFNFDKERGFVYASVPKRSLYGSPSSGGMSRGMDGSFGSNPGSGSGIMVQQNTY